MLAAILLCLVQEGPNPVPDPVVPGRGSASLDILSYSLSLSLDPPLPRTRGKAELEIRFREASTSVALDLNTALEVSRVLVDGAAVRFAHRKDKLVFPVGRRKKGDILRAQVSYAGELARPPWQGDPVGLIPDPHSLVAMLEPDGAMNWFPCNDHPFDKATFKVAVEVPLGHLAASVGRLESIHLLYSGRLRFTWTTDLPVATYLVPLGAGILSPILRPGRVPVLDLVEPGDLKAARWSLREVPDMIPVFEEWFGPYPFEKYGHVLSRAVSGGMEDQTLSILERNWALAGDPDLLSHELAHQWFGDWVSPVRWEDLWINEGWATYGELIWRRHDAPGSERELLKTWRRSVLRLARRDSPHTLDTPNVDAMFDVDLVYNKGGMVVHLLEGWMGREAFLKGIARFMTAHAGGNANTEAFQEAMEQGGDMDLKPFFDAWVRSNRVPQISLSWKTRRAGKGWTTVVSLEQVQAGPWIPIATDLGFSPGETGPVRARKPVRFEAGKAKVSFNSDWKPKKVVLDPGKLLPVLSPNNRR